jgi:hypothetical protein
MLVMMVLLRWDGVWVGGWFILVEFVNEAALTLFTFTEGDIRACLKHSPSPFTLKQSAKAKIEFRATNRVTCDRYGLM